MIEKGLSVPIIYVETWNSLGLLQTFETLFGLIGSCSIR